MSYELREGQGSLFKNDKKTTDSQPNAKGDCLIGGVPYWVSAWTKKDKNGNPWQSLAFTPKDEAKREAKPAQTTPPKAHAFDDIDDDIPF